MSDRMPDRTSAAAAAAEERALIGLLDDEDPRVQQPILERLQRDASLRDRIWQRAAADAAQREERPVPVLLVQLILREDAEGLIDAFAAAEDLSAGAFLLPLLERPRRDHRTPGLIAIAALAQRARREGCRDAAAIAHYLGAACGFSGDRVDDDHPDRSMLDRVLIQRVGLPIALTVLWMLVCRRLGLACEALALPGTVLGRCADGRIIDLCTGGSTVARSELRARLRRLGSAPQDGYIAAASDRALLRRMARNLVGSYLRRNDTLRASIAHGLATA